MTSRTLSSKNRLAFADLINNAVSAPLPEPAMAMMSLSTGIRPASVAIKAISTQTFVPSPNSLSVLAIISRGSIVPNSFRIAL